MENPDAELTLPTATGFDETDGPSFSTEVDADGEHVVVHAVGDLDLGTAPLLTSAISDAVRSAAASDRHVRLDLRNVEFIDSTGLRALLAGQATAAQAGIDLGVDGLSAAARRLLELTDTLERLRRGETEVRP